MSTIPNVQRSADFKSMGFRIWNAIVIYREVFVWVLFAFISFDFFIESERLPDLGGTPAILFAMALFSLGGGVWSIVETAVCAQQTGRRIKAHDFRIALLLVIGLFDLLFF